MYLPPRLQLRMALFIFSLFFILSSHSVLAASSPIQLSGTLYNKVTGAPEYGGQMLTFTLYENDSPSGVILWQETLYVELNSGRYIVVLGQNAHNQLPDNLDKQTAMLGVAVGNDAELSPRLALVPRFAQESLNATGDLTPRSLSITTKNGMIPVINSDGQWVGETLQQGERGETGPAGPQGPRGTTGEAGPQGSQGPQGMPGEQGPTGLTGTQGPTGEQGQTGPIGATGPIGPQGVQGPTGPQGESGDSLFTTHYGQDTGNAAAGTNPFDCVIGEVRLFANQNVGAGLPAIGQVLSINDYTALFTLLGTTYGGDGVTNFRLPDMRPITPNSMTWFICSSGLYPGT